MLSDRSYLPTCIHMIETGGTIRFLVDSLIEHGVPRADAYALECPEVHQMTAFLGRSNYLARTEGRLLLEEFPPNIGAAPRVDRRRAAWWSLVAASVAAVAVALFLICSPIWRTFT